MTTRLWWKEVKQFWPVWAFLVLVTLAGQGLALGVFGEALRSERHPGAILGSIAFLWSCLYAFAVAAASFAGEREGRTLSWLDALAVSRWRLWKSKAAFTVATSLMLGLILLGIALLSMQPWVDHPAQHAASRRCWF